MNRALTKREGLMLFLCEGDKPRDDLRKVQLTNSDPFVLCYFVQWLETFYHIPRESMRLRLHLWEGSGEEQAKRFWADILGIPSSNFTKTWFKPKGNKNTHPDGICRVSFSSKIIMRKVRNDLEREFYADSEILQGNRRYITRRPEIGLSPDWTFKRAAR